MEMLNITGKEVDRFGIKERVYLEIGVSFFYGTCFFGSWTTANPLPNILKHKSFP
jgi:hypothetical protein